MTLMIDLPPELGARLGEEARRQGVSEADCALKYLEQHLPTTDRHAQLAKLMQLWQQDDEPEESEEATDEFLRGIDEHRTSNRPLFPPEMKGVTW